MRALPIPGSTLSALRRHVLANSFKTSNTVVVAWPHLLKSLGFDATSLQHFDAAELAPSTASLAAETVRADRQLISAMPQNRTYVASIATLSPLPDVLHRAHLMTITF